MDIAQLLSQVQNGARVSTAVGDPVQVGDRVVIPVAEVAYGGGGGGGSGKANTEQAEGGGGGGGGGVRIRPLGCWVIGPDDELWIPSLDVNRMIMLGGAIFALLLVTIRTIALRRR
jgi:uncharacterized spore protein YtfJ